jgi:hypothetical protein
VNGYIDELRGIVSKVKAVNDSSLGATGAWLGETVESLSRTTQWLLAQRSSNGALAGATPYLRLFGMAAGGCMMAEDALASLRDGSAGAGRVALARFFAENIAVQAQGLEREVIEGADSVTNAEAALA